MSSKRSYVSGAGWRSETTIVVFRIWLNCFSVFTIWKVVELSNPVDISSINKALAGPTSISPVVTRFLCPPEIPLIISSPTRVSAQPSSPNIYKTH
ncbi:hypothetical protein LINPERHAP2_LOCUS5271 [Linum perenne]